MSFEPSSRASALSLAQRSGTKGEARGAAMPSAATRVAAAGFVATAVACGPARMGFGLFVPGFREEFALDAATIGAIGSGAFAAAFAALLVVGALTRRHGARVPVLLGCIAAALGLAIVSTARGPVALALGAALAATSSGLCWVPYNRAVERSVRPGRRARTLSIVSTGTTAGIVVAGALALGAPALGLSWRASWIAFAVLAVAAGCINAALLPRGGGAPDADAGRRPALAALVVPGALHLHVAAAGFGLLYALFLSFGSDLVVARTGAGPDMGAWLFVAFGLAGIAGLATGNLARRIGTARLTAMCFAGIALSLGALAFDAGNAWLAILAAALLGAMTMIVCAALSLRSLEVYPTLPALGFNATIVALTLGSVAGPLMAGPAVDAYGAASVFGAAGALSLVLMLGLLARSSRPAHPEPADGSSPVQGV